MKSLLLTPCEVLELLGPGKIGRNRLYAWIRGGKLPAVKDGSRYYISRQALDRLVAEIAEGRWPDERTVPR